MDQPSEFEERMAALEARVAALEGGQTSQPERSAAERERSDGDATSIVRLEITNKRFDAGEYQSHIWFDCLFTAVGVAHPTRAIKGTIEFCDLFGDPKLTIEHVITDRLEPGSSVTQPGLGIVFNEFMSPHQWLLGTELKDMTVRFRVSQILDEDAAISGHGAEVPSVQNSIPATVESDTTVDGAPEAPQGVATHSHDEQVAILEKEIAELAKQGWSVHGRVGPYEVSLKRKSGLTARQFLPLWVEDDGSLWTNAQGVMEGGRLRDVPSLLSNPQVQLQPTLWKPAPGL